MSARHTAQTAALEALIEAHASELKLPTVKTRFRQMAAEAVREQQTPIAYLAALLQAEHREPPSGANAVACSTPGSRCSSGWRSSGSPITPTCPRQRSPRSPTGPGSTTAIP
jgi:hypothetical protein